MSVQTQASIRKQRLANNLCGDCGKPRLPMAILNRKNQTVVRVLANETQCGTCRWERGSR